MVTQFFSTRDAFFERNPEFDAELIGDALCLAHHRRRDRTAGWILADSRQGSARQRTDGVEAEVTPKLEPYFRANIAQDWRLHSALDKAACNLGHALAGRAVGLANRKSIALDMSDHARGNQFRGRIHHAANDALARDLVVNLAARVDAIDPHACKCTAMAMKIP